MADRLWRSIFTPSPFAALTKMLFDNPKKNFYVLAALFVMFVTFDARAESCDFINESFVQKVTWTEIVGFKQDGENLIKNMDTGWNANVTAFRHLAGNGAIEVQISDNFKKRVFGLTSDRYAKGLASLDFSVQLTAYKKLLVYEQGVFKSEIGSYKGGDTLRIARKGHVISYAVNGERRYSSDVDVVVDLFFKALLFHKDAVLDQTKIIGSNSFYADIEWIDLVGLTSTADGLFKQKGSGWSNGAASSQHIIGDGAAQFTMSDDGVTQVFGLSNENKGSGYENIDYALYTAADGTLFIFENGFNKGSFGRYKKGDELRIERRKGEISFKRNCEVFYTSAKRSEGALVVDVAIYSRGAAISDAVIMGASN